jgi:predicted dehydrogenase
MENPVSHPSIRWGILGCARIARRGLIPGIHHSQSGLLTAIASRSPETVRAWADEFHIPHAHASYEALLADPQVDAVYIPLPNELHLPWTLAAADAGKHVLCEKPLARNAQEAARMVEHCRKRGVVLMEAFMWKHQPRAASLRLLVRNGTIGRLKLVRSSFSFPIDPADWRLDPARGGGALWDIGCYGVSTARFFAAAEPASVQASAHFGPTGVDLSLAASLVFPNDVLATIDCSFEQAFRCSFELVGDQGSIEVPRAYLTPKPPDPPVALHYDAEGAFVETLRFSPLDHYAAMVDAFGRAAHDPRRTLPDIAEDGLAQMRVLDRIIQAARASRNA